MKTIWIVAVLAMTGALFAGGARAEVQTVPYVDPQKYVGYWYQIAHIPMWFEGGNCACARQSLWLTRTPGVLGIYQSCNENDARGDLKTIQGQATLDDTSTNAKLTVDFRSPIRVSYWIIGLDPNYRYAVVSDANALSLNILSRYPTLSDSLYREALALAAKQMDTSKLVITDQKNCRYPR